MGFGSIEISAYSSNTFKPKPLINEVELVVKRGVERRLLVSWTTKERKNQQMITN
ncbi:MAG: hypothetical protein QW579_04485 [Desulfurococcaceae archaeon]